MSSTTDPDLIPTLLLYCTIATFIWQGLGFIHGFIYQTEKFFDALGGLNSLSYTIIAGLVLHIFEQDNEPEWPEDQGLFQHPRKLVAAIEFSLSRLWLLAFLAWRARERKGDSRFEAWKPYFFKFGMVWLLQVFWCLCIAMPLIVITGNSTATEKDTFGVGDWISSIFFGIGLLLEVVADVQKAKWVKNGRDGGFCEVGLWSWSRHPNYFGEMLMWMSMWGLTFEPLINNEKRPYGTTLPKSVAEPPTSAWIFISLVSPLFTFFVLLFASGLPLTEGQSLKRYYTSKDDDLRRRYRRYRESTSILLPMPTFLWKSLPKFLKTTLLAEWERYEYKEELEVIDGGQNIEKNTNIVNTVSDSDGKIERDPASENNVTDANDSDTNIQLTMASSE